MRCRPIHLLKLEMHYDVSWHGAKKVGQAMECKHVFVRVAPVGSWDGKTLINSSRKEALESKPNSHASSPVIRDIRMDGY